MFAHIPSDGRHVTNLCTLFSPYFMGRDIKVESFKVDTRVRHLGQQKKVLGRKNYIFSLT